MIPFLAPPSSAGLFLSGLCAECAQAGPRRCKRRAPAPEIPKRYAAGLEIRCPGGALSQTGPSNPQPAITSNRYANNPPVHAGGRFSFQPLRFLRAAVRARLRIGRNGRERNQAVRSTIATHSGRPIGEAFAARATIVTLCPGFPRLVGLKESSPPGRAGGFFTGWPLSGNKRNLLYFPDLILGIAKGGGCIVRALVR
jgi:hypothetical protein